MRTNMRRGAVGIAAVVLGLFLLFGREEARRVWIDAGASAPERPARWPALGARPGAAESDGSRPTRRTDAPDLRDAPSNEVQTHPLETAALPATSPMFPGIVPGGTGTGWWQGSAFLEIVTARRGDDGRVHYDVAAALPMRSAGRASPRALHRAPVWPAGDRRVGAPPRSAPPPPNPARTTPAPAGVAGPRAVPPEPPRETEPAGSAEAASSGWEGFEAAGLPEAVGGWIRRFHERFSERRARAARPPRMSLRALLGRGLLRPPAGRLVPPDFSKLGPPPVPPDRRRVDARPPGPSEVEALAPPDEDAARSAGRRERRRKPHWHPGGGVDYYHAGTRWGLLRGERWAWMLRSGERWWTLGDQTPLVRHQGHWWWRTSDGWFLLHYGQPWAYRLFTDLRKDGLLHPLTRVRIVYSEDARRAALVVPEGETLVYDVASGEIVARIPAEPARGGGLTPGPRP